jgi:hypothetical protein
MYQYSDRLNQRFSNFFQVRTTFISNNVLRTTLLLSALKANRLRYSTTVCDTHLTLIWFFCLFLTNVQSKRTTRAEPEDHSLGNAGLNTTVYHTHTHIYIYMALATMFRPLSGSSSGLYKLTKYSTYLGFFGFSCQTGSRVVFYHYHCYMLWLIL